eukprot:superscaffoldBa00003594_g17286
MTFKKENTKGLEKIFKTDVFLLYYLRDNPKAFKVLEKQLSAIGCKVELNFDEEEAVVRGDIEKGPGGALGSAAERWELQDLNFVTDDIKVYTEDGYAVVVGDVQAVKERIANLEKRLPTCKELPVVEEQFRLIEHLQNVHLRCTYEVQKRNISDENRQAGGA